MKMPRFLLALCLICVTSLTQAEETFTLNFKDADIKELIKFVADATGYTVIVDPKVKGNVDLISQEAVDKEEMYDLFLAVLQMQGYTAVKNGNVLRIVQDKTARSSAIPVIKKSPERYNATFITQVIELENVNATKLIPVLRPLVPQEGHMAAYADTNAIIISDTAENVKKIIDIIAQLDKSTYQETEILHLQNASAEEIVRILNQVVKNAGGDKSANEDQSVALVADSRSNSVIVSGTMQGRARIKTLIQALDNPLEVVGNAQVFYLRYASAKDLAPILSKVSQNMAQLDSDTKGKSTQNRSASIEADESTNSLIITGQTDVMEGLKAIISRLDVPRAQVLVEAIIVEVMEKNGKALGFDWMTVSEQGGFIGANNSESLLASLASGAFDEDTDDAVKGIASALGSAKGGVWGGAEFDTTGISFAAIITALQTTGEANILSTPSLMTLNNSEASIVVGQEVPFVTGSYTSTGSSSSDPTNPFQTISRENVGITLNVTPHVNEGGVLTLDIQQEVSGLVGSTAELSTADVVTNQRKIDTKVTTQNGEIIVLGGLIRDEVQESVSKVPILGDLPVIGRLFKSSSTDVTKTNLMVFIRPTVVRSSEETMALSEKQYRSIRTSQLYKRARGVDLFDDEESPLLPEWEKQLEAAKRMQEEMRKPSANDSGSDVPAAPAAEAQAD